MRNHVRIDKKVTKFSTLIDVLYFMVEDRMEKKGVQVAGVAGPILEQTDAVATTVFFDNLSQRQYKPHESTIQG